MTPGGGAPVVVGRHVELEQLRDLARWVAAGEGAAAVIEGEPGIGKTTVLDAVAADCAQLQLRVLRGAAEELERQLPFSAIGSCLGLRSGAPDPEAAPVADLLRGEGALGRNTAALNHELVVTETILELVDRWCAQSPVAVIIDDTQWADPSSLLVLHRLGHSVGDQPLLLVIATRPVLAEEPVTGLVRSLTARGARMLTLPPLAEPAVATLVERLLGAPAGPGLLSLVSGAGGNPMYVTELVGALFREGLINTSGGVAEAAADVTDSMRGWLPRSLVEAIMQQLEFLPPNARETLQMAATLGPNIDVSELATVLNTSVMQLWAVVHVAMQVGLVTEAGDELVFRHNLIREALAEGLPASVRAAVHLRAGQALAAAGAPVERVAEYVLAGGAMDRQALEWLVRSAESLTARAPQLAVRLLRRAVPAATGETAEAVRFHLARALLWAGELGEAEQATRTALATDHAPHREGPLRWLLAQACFRQGHMANAATAAEEAVTSPAVTEAEIGRFYGLAATCFVFQKRLDAVEAAAAKATAAGEASGDHIAVGYGFYAQAVLRYHQGRLSEALTLAERAQQLLEEGIQPDLQVDPIGLRGHCLLELDRLVEADEALAAAVQTNIRTGGTFLALNQLARVRLRFLDGRWDDALAEVQTGLDMPDPLGYTVGMQGIARLIAVHRGTFRDDIEVLAEPDERPGRSFGHLSLWAKALIHETQGDSQAALRAIVRATEHSAGLVPPVILLPLYPDLVRLATAVGDRKRAHEIVALAESLAGADATPSRRGTALLCRGMLEDDPDRLRAATQEFREAKRPLPEANAYENAAAVLARLHHTAEARAALNAALERYARVDASWDISRAEARLRQAGIRRGVHGPRKRPKQGWEALTETETRIALLVAEGRSNPDIAAQLFISRRTVQTHVSNILAKLNLHSRVELAVAAAHR